MKSLRIALSISILLGLSNLLYGQSEYLVLKNDTAKILGDVSKSGQTIKLLIGENKAKYNLSEISEYSNSGEIYQVFEEDGFFTVFPLKVRGKVNLYIKTKGSGINTAYIYYVKKEMQKYPQRVGAAQTTFHNKNFRIEYSEYFKDCEKVKEMILNKVVKPIDINYIVETYNKCLE